MSSLGGTDAYVVKYFSCIQPADPTNITPPSSQTICAGSSTSLSANSGTNTINWFTTATSTNVIGTGTLFATPVLAIGTYSYYAEASGCTTSFSRTEITVSVQFCTRISTDVKDVTDINVYPNPNNGRFTISLFQDAEILITDVLGRSVYHKN